MRGWHHDGSVVDPCVGFHSLSTLLMYGDIRCVYQFFYVVTTRIATTDGVGAFTLDSTPSGETYGVLRQLFDAMVEVRPGDGGSEFRVHGSDFGPRA